MARYRSGNVNMSEEEYEEDRNALWAIGLFLGGSLLSGFLCYEFLVNPEWNKIVRFTIIIIAGCIGGGLLASLHKIIRTIIFYALFGTIIYFVGKLIWSFV